LPFAPKQPVQFAEQPDRPQPRLDRNRERGMAVTVGRLRPCSLLDWKFVLLSHNTVRGAAGATILNAELLASLGKLKSGTPGDRPEPSGRSRRWEPDAATIARA
jgi:aspartate-semialdehyde dehydrogenase